MTRDEAKQLIENIEFVKAFASGEIVERNFKDLEFIKGWASFENMEFMANHDEYRIKQKNKKVPMTYEDFKNMDMVWLRNIRNPKEHSQVYCFYEDGMAVHNWDICYDIFDEEFEWSTDRVNWHKFEKEI